MNLNKIFSAKRLSNYKDELEHKNNFLLIQKLSSKLGVIEIATRNAVASELDIKTILSYLGNRSVTGRR